MKICFLIPDGVGIRNYLYSDLLRILHKEGHEIVIWHSLDKEVIDIFSALNGFLPEQINFIPQKEEFIIQLLRESSSYARLKHHTSITGNSSIMLNWHEKKGSAKRKGLVWVSELIGKTLKNYKSIVATENIYFARLRKTDIYRSQKAKLKEINPDILFCTHQRYQGASYALAAGEDLGIKTVSAIFSWDNLPKARLPIRAKYYLVWSRYMAEELQFYYPEIIKNQIIITGTPQFDFYNDPNNLTSREDFAAQFGLDPMKKWVLFSGDDSKTSPHDHKYLEDVAESIKNESDIQLIFRQVPVEGISRYKEVLEKYPQLIHINPFWKRGTYWQQFFPYPEDISHLVNLAYHCGTVINIGSTMALDFAFFEKPALYLKYDHTPNQKWTVKDIYSFQHFKSMEGLDAVGWIDSPESIRKMVRTAIDYPEKVGKDRAKWLDKIVNPNPDQSSSKRIANFFNSILNSNPQYT